MLFYTSTVGRCNVSVPPRSLRGNWGKKMEDYQCWSNIVLCPRSRVLMLAAATRGLLTPGHPYLLTYLGLCPRLYKFRENPQVNAQRNAVVKTGLVREGKWRLSSVSQAFGEDLRELSYPVQCCDLPPGSFKYSVATTASKK